MEEFIERHHDDLTKWSWTPTTMPLPHNNYKQIYATTPHHNKLPRKRRRIRTPETKTILLTSRIHTMVNLLQLLVISFTYTLFLSCVICDEVDFFMAHHGNITSPPTMRKQPGHEQLFQPSTGDENDHPFTLDCEADGVPEPSYYWTKNGARFNYVAYDKRISQRPRLGTLVFNKPDAVDEGLYQCFAENVHGTSMSNSVYLRKSELSSFPEEPPREYTIIEGSPHTIDCNPPSGYPKPSIYWMILSNTGALHSINSSRLTLDPEGRLHFSNVTKQDQLNNALYACSATSHYRTEYKVGRKTRLIVLSNSASLVKHAPEAQYLSPPTVPALRGQKLMLYCIYGGTPLPEIVWRKKGGSLEGNRFSYLNYGKTLVIFDVDHTDDGIYECTASNGHGAQLSHAITVTVSSAPHWIISPSNAIAAQDENIAFQCTAGGKPKPNLQWLLNGQPLDTKSRPNMKLNGEQLLLDSLKKSDMGVYQCNASNIHGYAFKDFYLNVLDLRPQIVASPERVSKAVVSSTVTLKCRLFGAPKPEVRWRRDNIELSGGRYKVLENGDLQIEQVMPTDQGRYRCRGANKHGEVTVEGELHVKGRTKIIQPPENIELSASKTAVLRCNAEADPTLELAVLWLYNGRVIDFDSDPRMIQSRDNSLSISKTRELDSGNYTCLAKTPLDHVSSSATLTVQDVPNPPKITKLECDDYTATISWTPTGDRRAPILGYDIYFNTTTSPGEWKIAFHDIPAPDNKFTMQLLPYSNTTFRVVAKNKIGPSLPSRPSDVCTTGKAAPSKNPSDVRGRGSSPNNLVITWAPMLPSEHNGPGFFYKVFWRRDDIPDGQYRQEKINDYTQSKYIINDQPTYVPYRIKVEAHNSMGQATVSAKEVIGYSGQNSPTQEPRNFRMTSLISPKSAQFAWDPIPPESIRGKFKGYKIQAWVPSDNDPSTHMQQVTVGNTTLAEVEILRPYANNSVHIMALNEEFLGPASNVVTVTTPEGTPEPVSSLIASPMGSSAFYLVWKKPERPNGVLKGYEIDYEELDGTQLKEKVRRNPSIDDPHESKAKLAGLKPNTRYRITITGKTSAGEGSPYYIEASTKGSQDIVPDEPSFLWHKISEEKNSFKITWLPNYKHLKPGSAFYVQFRKFGETQWQKSPVEPNLEAVLIKGLEGSSLYEVRVVSVDGPYQTPSKIEEIATDGFRHSPSSDPLADPGWFIGLLCAIAVLVAIFVLVCLVKQNRGGRYLVHEKEIALGQDTDDYEDAGFNEYKGP